MNWYEISPFHFPGGGGFNIIRFNLQAFYQLHQKALNYWTQSNTTYPLIRYSGCSIKLYASNNTDYIATYHNCLPMEATLDTYQSTHPTIMQLNNRHKIVRCKQNRNYKKPYTKLKIRPPSQLTKQWYFQKELATTPLLMLMVTGMSLDRYYMGSKSISLTIGFKSLNTKIFQYHNWKTQGTEMYSPKENIYLYALKNGHTDIAKEKVVNLIALGQTKTIGEGQTILETKKTSQTALQAFQTYYS